MISMVDFSFLCEKCADLGKSVRAERGERVCKMHMLDVEEDLYCSVHHSGYHVVSHGLSLDDVKRMGLKVLTDDGVVVSAEEYELMEKRDG